MDDCLIIGGGVIGLSLAYELARQGRQVRLVERGAIGREASWAGAGLLPPANRATATDGYEALAGLSHELHPRWAADLREETGIDNGYRRTGSIHIARDEPSEALLREAARQWTARGLIAEEISPSDLMRTEAGLAHPALLESLRVAYLLPDEAQVRNPRHLKALAIAVTLRGVQIETGIAIEDFEVRSGRIAAVQTSAGVRSAEAVCLTAGAWTGSLSRRLGLELPMHPIRGQMVLLASLERPLLRIVNEGRRYVVPRPDGRVLIGSTEEDAGFDKRTTAEGINGLLGFALDLVPSLARATVEATWAGLRPGTADGLPYLGAIRGLANAFIAAGHFRGGLHQSPGTAVVMSQLMSGQKPEIDLDLFRVDRHSRR